MKIKALKQGGLAINCRKTVFFKKGDILQAGDSGLAEVNIQRLVELGLAVEITDGERHVDKAVEKTKSLNPGNIGIDDSSATREHPTVDAVVDKSDEESVPYYKRIEDKTELDTFAKEQYHIALDRRQTLQGMQAQFEQELKKLEDEGE